MTKEEIMDRCRKVAIKIEGNRIFGDPQQPYAQIHAYRNRELAERNLRVTNCTISNDPAKRESICEFYLVPASRIDQ